MKQQRTKGGNNLSSKEKENYKSDIKDETDLNQVNNEKNLLQF